MVGFGRYRSLRRVSPRAENEEMPFGCFVMIVAPVLFVVSSWYSWEELWYAARGQTTEATVNEVREVRNPRRSPLFRRGSGAMHYGVKYTFTDSATGEDRTERDEIPRSWDKPEGTVQVEYLAESPGWSRLAGNRNYFSVVFFVVGSAALIVSGVLLVREARQAVAESEAHEAWRRRH